MVAPLAMLCGSRSLPVASAPLVGRVVSALLGSGSLLAVGCAVGADAAAISSVLAAGAAPRLQVWCAFGPVSPPVRGVEQGSPLGMRPPVGGPSPMTGTRPTEGRTPAALPPGPPSASRGSPWSAARYSAPGACSASAVSTVAAALLAGAEVRWWAGGPASVPLRARLVGRSLACVRAAARSGPGSGLVAFVAQPPPRPFAAGAWPSCGSGSWASAAAAARLGLAVFVVPVGALAGVSVSSLPALAGRGAWVPVSAGVVSVGFRWVR